MLQLAGKVGGQPSGHHNQLFVKDGMGQRQTLGLPKTLSSLGAAPPPPPPPPPPPSYHHRSSAQPPSFDTVREEQCETEVQEGAGDSWPTTMKFIDNLTVEEYHYVDFVDCDKEVIATFRVRDKMFLKLHKSHYTILYNMVNRRLDSFVDEVERTPNHTTLVLKCPNIPIESPQQVNRPSASSTSTTSYGAMRPKRLETQSSAEALDEICHGNYGLNCFLIDDRFLQINNFVTLM